MRENASPGTRAESANRMTWFMKRKMSDGIAACDQHALDQRGAALTALPAATATKPTSNARRTALLLPVSISAIV